MSQEVVHELAPIILTTPPAGADGVAMVTGERVPVGEALLIDRANVYCTSTTPTQLNLYEDTVTPSNQLSGSNSGNRDEADFPLGLQIAPTRRLVAVWTNASAGSIGTIRLQVRRARDDGE